MDSVEKLDGGQKPPKIIKLSQDDDNVTSKNWNESCPSLSFKDFVTQRILNDSAQQKTIFLEGRFPGSEDKAVVILEKTPFSRENVDNILTKESDVQVDMDNDIYKTLRIFPPAKYNGIKSTVVYPATDKHIQKYMSQDAVLVAESAESYKNITLPHIEASRFSIQWVYNILEKKSEADRIVFEDKNPDTGFVLVPDMKWDGKQVEDLYLVAIVHPRGLKSLRDLTDEHLPLLENVLEKGLVSIEERYGVKKHKVRVYLHYQPSYYHLHIHFTHLKFNAPGCGVERAHLLSDVIDNIRLMPNYYQKKTLVFILREQDQLLHQFRDSGLLD